MGIELTKEAERRRTFAIISHPDAGKTTLTEKLLLYANAIHLAGSVKARRTSRHAVSDWMTMERERGISVTSSVLQFEHQSRVLNLLDTPGHADFSEDTYRTLAAVDSAVMLMDHSKGVEPRTKKLFDVCRLRKVPVITFMNKLDRAGLDPIELIDDVSSQLDLRCAPLFWPVGMGRNFKGVVEIATGDFLLFNAEAHGTTAILADRVPWKDAKDRVGAAEFDKVEEDLELIREAGETYDPAAFLRGELSPVFWGSAMSNFGVETLLDYLAREAARPSGRTTEDHIRIEPEEDRFSGFVFKIQANMNPRHRDRIAFLRVVSGCFHKGMEVKLARTKESLRLARPQSFMAQERASVEEAYPGDIVGLHDTGKLRVGDTLSTGSLLRFSGIPRFAPEFFGRMRLRDPLKRKQLDTGLEQLAYEGVVQVFFSPKEGPQSAVLGAVGVLQFEVLKERLKNEYSVDAIFENLPYRHARWIIGEERSVAWLRAGSSFKVLDDRNGQPVLLCETSWTIDYALEKAPGNLELFDIEPL
ncbi:MAG: peptide chain release factor 3 [Myxococcales bacterium]|nr:peptide chain release factor 3 [Myxococcales bacterium]